MPRSSPIAPGPIATNSSAVSPLTVAPTARGTTAGYVEGSLARIVEAAAGRTPVLASVKADPAFQCGTEFDSLTRELAFFDRHGLHVSRHTVEIRLRPGELLVFDNLVVAHGRRGSRQPGELVQRVYGHRDLPVEEQTRLRDGVLRLFTTG